MEDKREFTVQYEVVKLSAYTCIRTCNSSNSVLNSSESDKIDMGIQGPKI